VLPTGQQVDWVVAREFAPVLRGHPRIGRLWEFDRSLGLGGWLGLLGELRKQGYGEVLDLHSSLRTRIARVYFLFSGGSPRWRRFSKSRWRFYGLMLFKRLWPRRLQPGRFVERFARFAGESRSGSRSGNGSERPDLRHLLLGHEPGGGKALGLSVNGGPYYCVMPGSKWAGKCWPAESYFDAITSHPEWGLPVVLGGERDAGSRELVARLAATGIAHVSGVGRWDLAQVARVLAGARAYLGNDTGLAHLAEAVGRPALVIYGPTSSRMGFAPWRAESAVVEWRDLACRPCGKDGRRCYRPVRKYLCLRGLGVDQVAKRFAEMVALAPAEASGAEREPGR
jgi:ADP-heptose:LPS heptosyltransferase